MHACCPPSFGGALTLAKEKRNVNTRTKQTGNSEILSGMLSYNQIAPKWQGLEYPRCDGASPQRVLSDLHFCTHFTRPQTCRI